MIALLHAQRRTEIEGIQRQAEFLSILLASTYWNLSTLLLFVHCLGSHRRSNGVKAKPLILKVSSASATEGLATDWNCHRSTRANPVCGEWSWQRQQLAAAPGSLRSS